MTIHVLLFAHLADLVGVRDITLELPCGATVADALEELKSSYPAIGALNETLAFAVDEVYVTTDTVLTAGQTLALLPPVSGG